VSANHLLELATDTVRKAMERGATGAECSISEGDEFSAEIRMREIENLKEAGSRGMGIRVLKGKRSGSSYTSDLSAEGVERMIRSALEIAELTSEDPHAGLPEPEELGAIPGDLQLYSDAIGALDPAEKIDRAKRAEAAAFAVDPRISNSDGASYDSGTSRHIFTNSHGFAGEYRTSSCSLSATPVARDGDSMERDYWYTMARDPHGLESPEKVGQIAAARALRRLNPVKVETQRVPVLFEPRTARSLLDSIFDAVHGMSIYRHESFLAGKLGETVASEFVTVVDDATRPGMFGTSPFDDEGVPSRRTPVIERGVLRNYLLNTYAARKLGMRTTGNAARGLAGNAGIGHGNFYLEPGVQRPDRMVSEISNGFLVTSLMGFGVNIVTGDYSRGASGVWIRGGELAFAVSEVTIAGNLRDMLLGVEAVSSDLEYSGSLGAPTLKIGEMTVGGK
jgi:PmbA protein